MRIYQKIKSETKENIKHVKNKNKFEQVGWYIILI